MRGDQPLLAAASWIVRASIRRLSVANPDTVVSRLGRLADPHPGESRYAYEPDQSHLPFRTFPAGPPHGLAGLALRPQPAGPRKAPAGPAPVRRPAPAARAVAPPALPHCGAMTHPVTTVLRERAERGSEPGAREDPHRVALVLEGGGMRGVVSAGVTAALQRLGPTGCFHLLVGASA